MAGSELEGREKEYLRLISEKLGAEYASGFICNSQTLLEQIG